MTNLKHLIKINKNKLRYQIIYRIHKINKNESKYKDLLYIKN